MAPKSVFLRNIIELQKKKIIPGDIAEKLSILPNDRLQRCFGVLFLDIVFLQLEHVDTLLEAESDSEFEVALRYIKSQISPRTLDTLGRNLLLAFMRYLSYLERMRPQVQQDQIEQAVDFLREKILRTTIVSISLHSKGDRDLQEKLNRMLYDLIHRE